MYKEETTNEGIRTHVYGIFAIMNPLSNLPAYMALVADDNDRIS